MKRIGLVLVLLLAACGDDDGGNGDVTYACDMRTAPQAQPYCQEYQGPSNIVNAYESTCTGTWSAGGCPRTDSLGGCQAPEDMSLVITTWYWESAGGYQTPAEVEAACTSPDVYLTP